MVELLNPEEVDEIAEDMFEDAVLYR